MDTGTLKRLLIEEMRHYAHEGLNARSYFTTNETDDLYTVLDIATVRGQRIVGTVLVARIQDNKIVVELDHNNKPLVDALTARGVPIEQVVLAYRDRTMPA